MSGTSNVSPRIILGIIVLIIGLVMLWCFWENKLLSPPMLTGLGFVLVGAHLIWLEAENPSLE